jgi:PqqD family protein of HPr-rel-A system
MKYKRNPDFDFIKIDEENITVFDPDSGNTHVIAGTGADILKLVNDENELDDIIRQLTKIYEVSADEINNDVSTFIDSLLERKIITV